MGGVSLRDALRMILEPSEFAKYVKLPRRRRERLLRGASGLEPCELPYLPSRRSIGCELPLVVNSVGLGGLAHLRQSQFGPARRSLVTANRVSVREGLSSRLLSQLAIPHVLAPDLVHTIRGDGPALVARAQPLIDPGAPTAVVQFSEAAVHGLNARDVAQALLRSRVLMDHAIKFFPAGSAPGHDRLSLYEAVCDELVRAAPGLEVSILRGAHPLEKAGVIAAANLVIGTSLHVMILAIAFDVPHVGLILPKLTCYADTWGDLYPYGASIMELSETVPYALRLADEASMPSLGSRLASRAQANLQTALVALHGKPTGHCQDGDARRAFVEMHSARGYRERIGFALHRLRTPLA